MSDKVWVVTVYGYESSMNVAVMSTEEKANELAASLDATTYYAACCDCHSGIYVMDFEVNTQIRDITNYAS